MVASDGSNRGENDVVELEAMRKDSFSWHPCQVSLCSSALGLVVQYGDYNVKEIISDKDGVLAHVRVRSTPLQGDDCSLLQQGNRVLATRNSQVKDLFYDAQVEEAFRMRHSKRNHCRCSFKIKWLYQAEEKASTVPASAVKKLSTQSIFLHPTISTFFSMLESSNGLKGSPFQLTAHNMKLEVDISMLLEKQIEDINKSSGVPESIASGFGGDLKRAHATALDAPLKDSCIEIPLLYNSRASMGTENKQSPVRTVKDSPDVIPAIQGQFMGRRSPLSPLAARAALALLRSNFHQSPEYSVQCNGDKREVYRSEADFSPNTQSSSDTSGRRSKKFESIAKTLFPASSSPPEIEFSKGFTGGQGNGVEKKRKNKEIWSAQQPSEKRFTRSQVQKNNEIHDSTQMTNVKETQVSPSLKSRRVPRPNDHKKLHAAAGDNSETYIRPQGCLSYVQNPFVSPVDGEDNKHSTEDKNLIGKNGMIDKVDPRNVSSARDSCSRRVTRSAAAREEMNKNKVQSYIKKGNSFSESGKLNLLKGNASPDNFLERENTDIRTNRTARDAGSMDRNGAGARKHTRPKPGDTIFRPRTRSQNRNNF